MNTNLTAIAVVLDRSGSMESVRADTIGGFNAFLADQQKQPGAATLTLAQFDDAYEVVHDGVPLAAVPPLTDATFVPRGSTALLDAIGRTVTELGARLAAMPEPARPGKVIVVVLTDGHENVSREYSHAAVHALITRQREAYAWEFLFLGAGLDAVAVGRGMGIAHNAQYDANPAGVARVFESTSASVSSYRGGGSPTIASKV